MALLAVDVRRAQVDFQEDAAAVVKVGLIVVVVGTFIRATGTIGAIAALTNAVVDPEFLSADLQFVHVAVEHKPSVEADRLRASGGVLDDRVADDLHLHATQHQRGCSEFAVSVEGAVARAIDLEHFESAKVEDVQANGVRRDRVEVKGDRGVVGVQHDRHQMGHGEAVLVVDVGGLLTLFSSST